MEFREIQATLETPCCLSERPALGNEVDTLDYIPGSALRGILAEAFLNAHGKPDELFGRLFADEVILFPNLYLEVGQIPAYPIPLSAYTCKSEPGFRSDERISDETERGHGVWDLLFEDQDGFQGRKDRRCHSGEGCANSPLQPHEGFYDGDTSTPKTVFLTTVISTRTAVNARTQSALDASLHSQCELPAGTEFRGMLAASDAHALEALESALGWPVTGYTGRRRAGKIIMKLEPLGIQSPQPAFLDWPSEEESLFFTLTLESDAILVDRLLRPVITLTPDILKDRQQTGFPLDVSVSVVKAFCATRRVSGWHSVARVFKPDDIAMVKGSTFLLKAPREAGEPVRQWMSRVIGDGIGLRRSEGFGRVRFNEPLHHLAARERGGPL